jgi:hypothetical protein
MIAGADDPREDVLEFLFVADEPEQRLAASPFCADPEEIFCSRIERNDQERAVQKDDAGIEAFEDVAGFPVEYLAVVVRRTATGLAARRI